MPEPETTLAVAGATAFVTAMATSAWQATRAAVVKLFRRGEQSQQEAIESQLEGNAALVAQADDAESARQALVPMWRLQLEALLRDHPESERELRELIDQVRGQLPAEQPQSQINVQAGRDAYTAARDMTVTHHHRDTRDTPPS
jgi:hypothetical protein